MIWVTISSVANLYAFRSLQKMLWFLSVTIPAIQISCLDKIENSANSACARKSWAGLYE